MLKLIGPALLLLACTASAQDKSWEEFRREAFAKEAEGVWKKIAWKKDMAAAIEAAKADKKPILVFLVVGEMGKKNAAEC